MKIWKQDCGVLTEAPWETIPENIQSEILGALPDEEGDYAPYMSEAHRLIAVTNRAWRDAELLLYSPTPDGGCVLEGSGLSTLGHIVVPTHSPTGQPYTEVAQLAFFMDDTVKSITFLGSVTIHPLAFNECSVLEAVTICGSIAAPEEQAFCESPSLHSFTAWDAAVTLGDKVFADCPSLAKFHVSRVCAMGDSAFSGCTSLETFTGIMEVHGIPSHAFAECAALTAIRLPEGLTEIGWCAFEGCARLTAIHLPEGLTTIGDSAFYDCTALTDVVVPHSVTRIGDSAFGHCRSLTHFKVPHGVARDTLLDDEDIRRFTDFWTLYCPDGWSSQNTDGYAAVEFVKLDT